MPPITDAEPTSPSLLRRVARIAGRLVLVVVAGLVAALVAAWCVGAIWYSNAGPPLLRACLAAAFVSAFAIAWIRTRRRRFVAGGFFLVAALIALAWRLVTPSHDRTWSPDMAVLPRAVFDGDRVRVENVRNAVYRSAEDFDVRHEDRTYDLARLETVDYMVEPFWGFRGSAHTLLTFGFEGGEYVAISVELRRERGEHFHPVPGMFKQYELAYIVGDERDLIRLRTNFREDEVYLYPIEAPPEKLRALFIDMLERANTLRERPEFYHTFANSCTTNIVDHINRIASKRVPFSVKVLLPGYSDELAYDLGLISHARPFEETRRRHRIDERARAIGDAEDFSDRIRAWE